MTVQKKEKEENPERLKDNIELLLPKKKTKKKR